MTTVDQTLQTLYDLVLNPATRDWERQQLLTAKRALETGARPAPTLANLEASLRPLAVRQNLTPAVADWYAVLTGEDRAAVVSDVSLHDAPDSPEQARAIFAGGCFWCMVEPFQTRPGIRAVISGYTGGDVAAPSYEQVSSGTTGHVEAVEIIYDPTMVHYEDLLTVYWQLIDPLDSTGQINDRGSQYVPKIFVGNDTEKAQAIASRERVAAQYGQAIPVAIVPRTTFWPAENYHQDYYQKHPKAFRQYEAGRKQWLAWRHLQRRLTKAKA